MSRWPVEEIHISDVVVGDTVFHQGNEMTVCVKNIKRDDFFGFLLFGDSYKLGTQKVKRLLIKRKTSA